MGVPWRVFASGVVLFLLASLCIPEPTATASSVVQETARPISFHNDIRPILQRKCQGCHQPAKAGGKLVLTSFEHLMKGGEGGSVIEAGKPDDSPLIDQISGNSPAMPKNAPPLSPKEVELIKRWVAEGSKDDTPPAAKDPIDQEHPPVYAAPPVISALAYSPDGKVLAVSGYREVLLHNAITPVSYTPNQRLVGQSHRIEAIAYSPDGKVLAVVGGQPAVFGEVQLWDAETNKLKHSEMLAYDVLYGASFTPDAQLLGMGCADKSARVVEAATGKQTVKIEQHDDWCFGASFSIDGKYVVTPGRDRHLKLMESATGSFIDNITSITPGVLGGPLYFVTRHPTKNEFLSGGDDGVPKLYQMLRTKARQIGDDFNLLRNYEKMPGRLTCGAFSKDGTKLVVGGTGEARIYQFEDGKLIAKLSGHRGGIFAVAFHPNGTQVATGGFDGQVRIYDANTGSLLTSFVPVPVQAQVAAAK
jgi:WD40 repeat protein/mono/diheme cytochrome c family protein